MAEANWMAGPNYLCRQHLIGKILKKLGKKRFLEVGVGVGDFIEKLSRKGYSGKGIDILEDVEELVNLDTSRIKIEKKDILDLKDEKYDIIMAFEVLEHIKEDKKTIKKMYELLNQGGYILLSIPAHMKLFGNRDKFNGHYRRYEKKDLMKTLKYNNFEIIHFWSYGVFISNLANHFANFYYKFRKSSGNREEGTRKSAVDTINFKLGKVLINNITMYPFYLIQSLFLNTDLGTCYLVLAKKKK